MSHTVKRIARGASAKVNSYAGPAGELVMDTTTNDLVLETGVAGGVRMAKASTAIAATNGLSVTAGGTLGEATTVSGVDATTAVKGVVQLSSSTSGTSETKAATEKAVKDALDAAKTYADQAAAGGGNYTGTAPIAVDQSTHVISAADATTSAKGVVQVGDNVTVSSGTISVKPWADSAASHTSVTVADYQEGAIIVTDEPVTAGATAVIAEVEQTVTSSTNKVPSSKAVQDAFNGSVPVGTIIWSGAATVPAGYLLCNGSAVGRTTYPELFAAIGTAFGSGDGSTTFNLPNLIDKFIEGANAAGTVKAAGLPNITGGAGAVVGGGGGINGAFFGTAKTPQGSTTGSGFHVNDIKFDASRSSSIYGNSTTVQPPAVTALPCIKAFSGVIGSATVVAGQLVNDIQGKVSLDGSNTSSISKTLSTYMANSAMPSGQSINMNANINNGMVTAPADGWLYMYAVLSAQGGYVALTGRVRGSNYGTVVSAGVVTTIPVSQGEEVSVTYNNVSGVQVLFFYANGSVIA